MNDPSIELAGPDEAAQALLDAERKVDNPYSCLVFVRAFEAQMLGELRHLILRADGEVSGVLSYRARGSTLTVVNRLLELPPGVLASCVARLFDANPNARRIVIDGLYDAGPSPNRATRGYPRRRWRGVENFEVALPSTLDEYMSVFGSRTRKNLRYSERRFRREHPGADLVVLEGGDIDAATVNAIVRLNHLRMESKGRESGLDTQYARKLLTLCRAHGVACIAREGGEVLAGTLCTRVGSGWCLHVIAHDPKLNHVRLGLVCLLRAVEAAIGSGATKFHFLWGDAPYKALFGGRMRPLWTHCYYRSHLHRLFAIRDVATGLKQRLRRRLAQWNRKHRAPAAEPEPA